LIAIIGASACGKSTLVDQFIKKYPVYKKLITYTTRDMRDGEKDGVDYHFISDEVFSNMSKDGVFIEEAEYNGWRYGISKEECESELTIVIVTPAGFRTLKRYGVDVIGVYLDVDRRSRLIASLLRGDDIEEAYRRSLSDVGMFDSFIDEVDHYINNERFELNHAQLIEKLEQIIGDANSE